MLPTYAINPTPPRGYELAGYRFGIVVPVATTNLLPNPSAEVDLTDWTTFGTASIARSTAWAWAGVASVYASGLAANSGPGYFLTSGAIVAGTTYTASARFKGEAGKTYQARCATTSATLSAPVVATGLPQEISVTHHADGSGFASLALIQIEAGGLNAFYTDAWQLEALPYATTYVDGDRRGFVAGRPDYAWTGVPHASTSTRSGQCRAGGRVLMLRSIGLYLVSIVGLGMLPVQPIATPLASGGGYYQTTIPQTRDFVLTGDFYAGNQRSLQAQRAELATALNPFVTTVRQPLLLTYQAFDACDRAIGEPCEIVAHYVDGMTGVADSEHHERVALSFRMFLPTIQRAASSAVALDVQAQLADAAGIAQRSAGGVWADVGDGVGIGGGSVLALLIGRDGSLYAAGDYAAMGGVGNTNRIAAWDGATWAPLGTGANSDVTALALGPDGSLYAAGAFTSMGGVANTSRIAKWDGSVWTPLSTGMNGTVYALAFAPDGTLYAGGAFTTAGGGAAVRIAKWNGSAWSALGTGANDNVYALAVTPDGTLYAGGVFTAMGGVADTAAIATWDGSAWAALSTGMDAEVDALALRADGTLIAGGAFTSAGGVSAAQIAAWNGTQWTPLGSGMNNSVRALQVGADGLLYAGGDFTMAGGVASDGAAIWTGTSWLPIDIAHGGVAAIAIRADGVLTLGGGGGATPSAAGVVTTTNAGTADAAPTIVISGPSSGSAAFTQIKNVTTGAAIYFSGLTISAGETITIVLEPTNISMVSNFQGNIIGKVIPGSNVSGWALQPGTNAISLFAFNDTIAATMTWRDAYLAIDDATTRAR